MRHLKNNFLPLHSFNHDLDECRSHLHILWHSLKRVKSLHFHSPINHKSCKIHKIGICSWIRLYEAPVPSVRHFLFSQSIVWNKTCLASVYKHLSENEWLEYIILFRGLDVGNHISFVFHFKIFRYLVLTELDSYEYIVNKN